MGDSYYECGARRVFMYSMCSRAADDDYFILHP